jgi:DnaJ domain
MNSYYDLLGVPPNATEMEIRSAYGRDVLRLQETTSDKVSQFRAALDAAFATLVDPAKRSEYDAQLATATQEHAAESADEAADAFRYARNGGLWFAGGGLVTALTYAFSEGTYFLAWGPLLFGGFQLVRGLIRYLTVPSGGRQAPHLALLAGLVLVGVLSAGFVGVTEMQAAQDENHRNAWNKMIDETGLLFDQASELVEAVGSRPGPWDPADSADMAKASALYKQIADEVAAAATPSRYEWYRAAISKNFYEAAAITREYSMLTASSPASAFEALEDRWHARVQEADALSDRFEEQERSGS